ncbi:shikimate kinase [Paralimibaculum aggregatum]|uniref:Shikimate kinase n=1 Tax=Paralimibaculum aggregatum TaxID=3036245 RepID=A0ABQ6LEX7_9RHOB|nr:shikimate kinase [Limibaculum sp. NKW23]GMG81886.1 shikimate kinase [Limibaculum sp. NKW23]
MGETGERDAPGPPAATGPAEAGTGRLLRPVVLIGLMGAGKSSVGQRLADFLGAPFCDSDNEVERAAGMTIAEIFERYGEADFRAGERKVIQRLLEDRPLVLATGGGAFMNAETRATIAGRAVSVWLRADLDTLVSRTAGRTHRPLLNRGNPREILGRLVEERYPVYAEADCHVDSLRDQSHEAMARRIIAALEAHEGPGGPVLAPAG